MIYQPQMNGELYTFLKSRKETEHSVHCSWLMPMRQSLMEQLHNYKKGGLVDIGMLQQAIHVDSS